MTGRRIAGEKERAPAGALDSLGRVLSELIHDLAGDLVVLQGWAQLARGEAEAGRTPTAELDRVVELSDSTGAMLRDLLSVTEGRTLSPEVTFAPRSVTEDGLARRVRELSGLTVRFRTELPPEAQVRGFASFWNRIISNLLSNAARHARTEILVTLETAGGEVVLRVEDDGPGVPADARARVFEPLWTAGGTGIGLGLSSVSWLALKLGGGATCTEPRELTGAAFEVRAPLAVPARASAPSTSVREIIRDTRILLVDDDSAVRRALCRLLMRVGAEVRELDPREHPDEEMLDAVIAAMPDAVLLDLRLGRRGGTALWQNLLEQVPTVARRTVFITGAAPGDPDWEVASATGQPVLAKPFTLQQLAEILERLG